MFKVYVNWFYSYFKCILNKDEIICTLNTLLLHTLIA